MTLEQYTKLSAFYSGIILTDEEVKLALLEGQIAKYFREKNQPYWDEQEKQIPKDHDNQRSKVQKGKGPAN